MWCSGWCLGLLCGLLWWSGWCLRFYVGYCGAMVGVWGYCGVVVGVWDSCVVIRVKWLVSQAPVFVSVVK